jgi:catechol 2,3-dioxygenase-like lactoylglutathione lyase family enzyme
MSQFHSPMINLYSRDLSRSLEFYRALGFEETFRTPSDGPPIHVEVSLNGFKVGIATVEAASRDHGLQPGFGARSMEIVLWCDDVDLATRTLMGMGAPLVSPAHDFLNGKLRAAWVADLDGNPIQLVQRRA